MAYLFLCVTNFAIFTTLRNSQKLVHRNYLCKTDLLDFSVVFRPALTFPLHPSTPLMWMPTYSSCVPPLLNWKILWRYASPRQLIAWRPNLIIMCKTVHFKLATLSDCLFQLQESWNQGGRGWGVRERIHHKTQHLGDWWWHSITDCTHQWITMPSPTPTQNTTRQYQHPESWGYVLDTPFCWAWRGDTWRISAITTVSNQASLTCWQITF